MHATRRVLVVDDDRMIAEVIAAIVATECDEVVLVGALGEARVELRKARFNLVILDLSLPDSRVMDTIAAIRELRQHCDHLVCITGTTITPRMDALAMAEGADVILAKGVEMADMLPVIASGIALPPKQRRSASSPQLVTA